MKFHQLMHQGGQWAATVLWKKDSEAPDYGPMAQASVEAANIADRLGRDQMAQARQLHDETMALARPVIDQQIRLSEQQIRQGDDYYNYMVSRQRPVEDSLQRQVFSGWEDGQNAAERQYIWDAQQQAAAEADNGRANIYNAYNTMLTNADNSRQNIMARSAALNDQNAAERALITGGDTGIYNARQADIEDSVGRAVADARSGQASATNQMIRQAARYGFSPERMAALAGQNGLAQASQQAAAANSTRQAGIDRSRALMGEGYNMRNASEAQMLNAMMNDRTMQMDQGAQNIQNYMNQRQMGMESANMRANAMMTSRNNRLSDNARSWAQRLDVAGLYRNLPGASQAAYGLSGQLGNSAIQNQMAPGNAMMSQNQGAMGTIMQGQGLKVQGMGNVLNAQTNFATSQSNQGSPLAGIAGMALGGWAGGGFKSPF